MKVHSIQKNVTFSNQLYHKIMDRADALGLDFQEYIRYLAVDDIKTTIVPTVDQKTENRIEAAEKDIKGGNYTTVSNEEEVDEHLSSL